MTFRLSEHAAPEHEGQRPPSNDSPFRVVIRRLSGATALGLFLTLQCSNSYPGTEVGTRVITANEPDHDDATEAENIRIDLESVADGESLMDRELYVVVKNCDGKTEEIPFRIQQGESGIELSVNKHIFYPRGSIPGIGEVSGDIGEVTIEGGLVRLYSARLGYADVHRDKVIAAVQDLSTMKDDQLEKTICFRATYVPPEGSGVKAIHMAYLSMNAMLGNEKKQEMTHPVTFRRALPPQNQIAQTDLK